VVKVTNVLQSARELELKYCEQIMSVIYRQVRNVNASQLKEY